MVGSSLFKMKGEPYVQTTVTQPNHEPISNDLAKITRPSSTQQQHTIPDSGCGSISLFRLFHAIALVSGSSARYAPAEGAG